MRRIPAFVALILLPLLVSCDTVTAAIPLGGKCHNRADGSVLKSVEDANGKQWPVVKYPTLNALGTTIEGLCAVSLEAKESAYQEPTRVYLQVGSDGRTTEREYDDPFRDHWFLHPETKEIIKVGGFGPYRGYLNLSLKYEWY